MSQIAWLSQGTVKRHLQMARLKLGALNTTHAVAIAYEAEILPLKQPSAA